MTAISEALAALSTVTDFTNTVPTNKGERRLLAGLLADIRLCLEQAAQEAERRPQQSTWVKCSERMPEDEESVWICLVVSRIVGPAKYYCTADAGEFSVEEGAYPLSCVSHWMPRHVPRRPSPPEAP